MRRRFLSTVATSSLIPSKCKYTIPTDSRKDCVLPLFPVNSLVDKSSIQNLILNAKGTESNRYWDGVLRSAGYHLPFPELVFVFNTMDTQKISLDRGNYNCILSICKKSKQYKYSLNVLDTMRNKGIKVDLISYNLVLSACAKAGKLEVAKRVMKEMMHNRISPDICSYNTLLSAYAKVGATKGSNKLMNQLITSGITPDIFTLNSLLLAFGKVKDLKKIKHIMETMPQKYGVSPDRVSYNTAIQACSAKKDFELANHFFSEMVLHDVVPDKFTYNAMMNTCLSISDYDKVLYYFMKMKLERVIPDAYTLSAVMRTYGYLGQWESVLLLLQQKEEFGIKYNTRMINSALDALSRSQKLNEILALLGDMKQRGVFLDDSSYMLAIAACDTKRNSTDEAIRLFEELLSSTVQPSVGCFAAIIRTCARSGRLDQVETYFSLMKTYQLQPNEDIFNWRIYSFGKAQQLEQAFLLFSSMVKLRKKPSLKTFNMLLDACASCRNSKMAMKIFQEEMDTFKIKPDRVSYTNLIRSIVEDDSEPISTAESILDEVGGLCGMDSYLTIIRYFLQKNQQEDAKRVWIKLEKCNMKLNTNFYIAALHCYGVNETHKVLEEMVEKNIYRSLELYNAILDILSQHGKWKQSYSILKQLQEDGLNPNLVSYQYILRACQTGKAPKYCIIEIWENLKFMKLEPDLQCFTFALVALHQQEAWGEVLSLLHELYEARIEPNDEILNLSLGRYFFDRMPPKESLPKDYKQDFQF